MKRMIIAIAVMVMVVSVAIPSFAGQFTFLSGKTVLFANEMEFVSVILDAFAPKITEGNAYFILTDTTKERDGVKFILTKPEQLELEESVPTNFYRTIETASTSKEYADASGKNGRKNIFFVEVEITTKDMVAIYNSKEKVANTRGIGSFKSLKQNW